MVEFSEDLETKYFQYLNDESGIFKRGHASRIYFPVSENELQQIVFEANENDIPITISGGGTGISGGRAPIGGWIIATDKMTSLYEPANSITWKDPGTGIAFQIHLQEMHDGSGLLTVPVAMTVKAIQNFTLEKGWYYPPDPTERTCFIGGNVNTNASGARSFKYGATRSWIQALRIILPTGQILSEFRDNTMIGSSIKLQLDGELLDIPIPTYNIPNVSKNVAGPVLTENSELIDLFIGSDGLFGIVTEVTLKVIKQPQSILTFFVFCPTRKAGLDIIEYCQSLKIADSDTVPMSVELLDERAIQIMRQKDPELPSSSKILLIIEQDIKYKGDTEKIIEYWFEVFSNLGLEDILLAQTHTEIEHFKELRHAVPETVNALVRANGQAKIGTDLSVPWESTRWIFEKCWEIGEKYEKYQEKRKTLQSFGYALWAHAGDAHVHLNLISRDEEEYQEGNTRVLSLIKEVISMGGSMAAEHGLGKKYFGGRPALSYQIGEKGIEEIKNMKAILDPKNLLNRGNLIGYDEYF